MLFTLLYHLDLTFVRLRLYFSVVLFIMVQTFEFVDEDLSSRAFQCCLLRSYLLRLRKNPKSGYSSNKFKKVCLQISKEKYKNT